ncbi:MAG: L-cysteine:1D-myo-inositol 2-amino-2-deoxy-alpha-D-glucopyranoside ligase [Candidatus Poriferisodalaceae bacterium]
MTSMRLFDTRQRQVVPFVAHGQVVRMYTCGITPYDSTHIGHARTFLTYDVLQRRLRDLGFETRCVRNVTDVDDSILERARALGVHYLDLAAAALTTFEADMTALGLLPAFSAPRATSAISDIRLLIGRVLDSGHAYESGGSVYFDVSTASDFGQLSLLDRDTMLERAAEHGGRPDDPHKRDPLDFVLWHPSAPGEPEWSSQWGPGRPGWHVECSALALRELGPDFDLHGGGSDLVFPHHECEWVQSEAATGTRFVRHWMHSGEVRLDGRKMSKSHGNLCLISELRRDWEPMAIRLAIIEAHYRTTLDWSDDLVVDATERLGQWRRTSAAAQGPGTAQALEEVRAALDDDLDATTAVAAIDRIANAGTGSVEPAAALLGVTW